MDLHNLFHFLALRLHEHAQYEIRVYAEAMAEMVKEKCPLAWEAFEDYRLGGMFLTTQDVEELQKLFSDLLKERRVKPTHELAHKTKREEDEYFAKLNRLGVWVNS